MDEEIKKLLVELNMEHLLDGSEQLQMIPVSDKIKQVIVQPKHKNEKKQEETQVLWQEIVTETEQKLEEKKAQSFVKKHYTTIKKSALLIFLFLGVFCAYLLMKHESPLSSNLPDDVIAQNSEIHLEEVAKESILPTSLVQECESERKEALEKIAVEISKLIQQQIQQKQPHFASQLTQLVAKCQETDESYQEKIATLELQLKSFANK